VKLPADDPRAISAFVAQRLAAMDHTPRDRYWRRRALGMSMADAIDSAPRYGRLDLHLTVGEIRVLRDCAKGRDLGLRPWVRAAVATAAICCDDVDPAMIPSLAGPGLLGPR
jgi:hypothetical protein